MRDPLFDLRAKQELHSGFGSAYARGWELALTPVVFGGIGWLVDRAVGTSLVFTIAFVLFSFAGVFVKVWIGYDADMRRQESQVPGFRSRAPSGRASGASGPSGADGRAR